MPSVLTACLLCISTPVPCVMALRRSRLGLPYDTRSSGDCRVQDAQGLHVGSSRHGLEVREALPIAVFFLTGSLRLAGICNCTPGSCLRRLKESPV